MIRLFAAVEAPEPIAQGLGRRQQGLPGARWRPPETLHITLRFFGAVTENVAADLDSELAQITWAPFQLSLEGVGCFGEGDDLRAVWAGVAPSKPLNVLAKRCERAARRAGLAPDRRVYKPHLTLAYLKRAEPARVAAWTASHNLLKSPEFRIDRFGLYSSWPTAQGSRYDLEREYPPG